MAEVRPAGQSLPADGGIGHGLSRTFGMGFMSPPRRPSSGLLSRVASWSVLVAALVAPSLAEAAAPFVVIDAASGRVLMQEDATMPWHPASVTKLMTTYVALKRLREGAIGWETPIPVSMRAARAVPSKVGLNPGQEVTLESAMKMMLVKAANDMAVVIAEGVGGSVENFAEMMNAEAARLGMRESHFENPNGLHVPGQQTSARDLAILARALLTEFPDQADLFQIPAVQLGERVMKNTNGLIGRYPGIEGMKTGFVCPSGFNLVAVASRGGQRLIAVVLGQPSAADRTIKAAALLDKGFGTSGGFFGLSGGTLESLPRSPVSVAPNMRQDICVRRKGPPASEEELDAGPVQVPAFQNAESGQPFSGAVFAAAVPGSSVRGSRGPRSLSERAPLEPIPVFVGRSPGSASAPIAANARPVPARPDEPATATAYAGDKGKLVNPLTGRPVAPVAAGAGPIVLAPAEAVPLKAGSGIGSGARPSDAKKLGAIEAKSAEPKAAVAKPVPTGKAAPVKAKAKPAAKAKPKAAAKPAAKAPAKTTAKPAGKTTGLAHPAGGA